MPNAARETDPRRSAELNAMQEPAGDSEPRRHGMELHANRLAILGQLSASIVHEVLQPIGATRTNAEAALHLLEHQPPDLDERCGGFVLSQSHVGSSWPMRLTMPLTSAENSLWTRCAVSMTSSSVSF